MNVHIYPSPLTHESRILRITDALMEANVFRVIEIVGLEHPGLPERERVASNISFVRIPRKFFSDRNDLLAKIFKTLEWSLRVLIYLRGKKVTCINAHSLAVLPLCALACLFSGASLVYDTHELETETSGYKGVRRKIGRFIENMLIRRSAIVVVVSQSISEWYAKTYKISSPIIVRNIPQFKTPELIDKSKLRAEIGLPNDKIIFMYQGGFIPGRGVERLLHVFSKCSSVYLVCMGDGPLKPVVIQAAEKYPNIHWIPPVSPKDVLRYSKAADAGICLTENTCLSHYYSLPNKVFEYLHAGLPIIINPLFEQKKLIDEFDCGWVSDDDDLKFAAMLEGITYQDLHTKQQGVHAAVQTLQWVDEKSRLIDAYKERGIGR